MRGEVSMSRRQAGKAGGEVIKANETEIFEMMFLFNSSSLLSGIVDSMQIETPIRPSVDLGCLADHKYRSQPILIVPLSPHCFMQTKLTIAPFGGIVPLLQSLVFPRMMLRTENQLLRNPGPII